MAQQLGSGLAVSAGPEVSRGLSSAVERSTRGTTTTVRKAGEQSGRVFGSGFGEGFAALAAFAIAARISRFFRETIAEAGAFSDAMAGVRKNVDGAAEAGTALEDIFKGLAEQFGISATEIAGVGEEVGKLGVPLENLAESTEAAIKAGIALDISAREAASGLTVLARLSGAPLTQIDNLASALAEVEAKTAGAAPEILRFATEAAAGLARVGLSAPQILALSAAFNEVGVRAESGARTLTLAIERLQIAAQTGEKVAELMVVTGIKTREEFQRLAQTDPGELFIRFLRGISTTGAQLTDTLDNIGLSNARLSRELGIGASQFERLGTLIDQTTAAYESNARVNEELANRQRSTADQMRRLEEAFRNTRIELGGKLAPLLVSALRPFANLETATVGLIAGFAGLAAGGFAFVRLSNILREFSGTLGRGALTATELSGVLRIQATTGLRLSQIMALLRQEHLSVAAAEAGLANNSEKVVAAFARQQEVGLGVVQAYRQIRNASVEAAATQLASAQAATRALASQIVAGTVSGRGGGGAIAAGAVTDALRRQKEAADELQRAMDGVGGATGRAAREALRAGGAFSRLLGFFGKVAFAAFAFDLVKQLVDPIGDAIDRLKFGVPDIDATATALEKLGASLSEPTERAKALGDAFEAAAVQVKFLRADNFPDLEELQQIFNLPGQISFDLLSVGGEATRTLKGLNDSLLEILSTQPKLAQALRTVLGDALVEQGANANLLALGFTEFDEAAARSADKANHFGLTLAQATASFRQAGLEGEALAQALQSIGFSADQVSGQVAGLAATAQAAAGALALLVQANAAFTQRTQSLIGPISAYTTVNQKAAKAAGGAGKAARGLADAKEDAAKRIAEAERRLAEAEEDAIERVMEARRRLDESRLSSSRRLRDAGQDLADFLAASARVGGIRTPEDEIRLRELRERVADETEDANLAEIEGQRGVAEAEEEGAERVAEAQRRLAEAHEEAADRIANASQKAAGAAADANKVIALSVDQMIAKFAAANRDLSTFSSLMDRAAEAVFENFPDRDIAAGFLNQLSEMGVDAIPILRKVLGASDKELKRLGAIMEKNVKEAKKAADKQFLKFEGNFTAQLTPAVNAAGSKINELIGAFDNLGPGTEEVQKQVSDQLKKMGDEFEILLATGKGTIDDIRRKYLDLARTTDSPIERVQALKDLLADLKSRGLTVTVDARTAPFETKVEAAIRALATKLRNMGEDIPREALGGTIVGRFAPRRAQFGFTSPAGQPVLVGHHTAEELFIPSTAGAIFRHTDTQKILDALRVTRANQNIYITVNEVAADPKATARAINFMLGANGAVR